jgi:dienelactone hydrolase
MKQGVLALAVAAACGSSSSPAKPDGTGTDAELPLAWDSVTVTMQTAQVVVEQVTYTSTAGGLELAGRVCRPNDGATHHVIAIDHGGFAGIGDDGGLCVALAQQGDVVLEASYRGEDASQGAIEVCLGEVDDVLRMFAIALAQPYADPAHVGIHGSSHGGCITLRALERGVPVRVASEGFGITDMAADYAYWQGELAADPTGMYASVEQGLIAQLDAAAGGPPSAVPAAYTARSPNAFLADLPASLSLMVAHGTADPLVDMRQSCTFAASVGGFHAYHLDSTQTVTTTAPANCPGFTWLPGPLPTTYAPGRYLLIYDGVGHEFTSPGGQAMALQLVEFVVANL